jgi:AcrR family transcriptional regulator
MTPVPAVEPALAYEFPESWPEPVRLRIMAYWRELGLTDPALIETLADDCLDRARRRVGRGSDEGELLRRALEEARRRFDHALTWALGLPPSEDHRPLAAARAAYLLAEERIPADSLFAPGASASDLSLRLRKALPRATPPEAPLPMPEAPLRFWLFKSPHEQ